MNRFPAPIVALLLALPATGCGDGRETLLLYSPHGRDLLAVVEEAYEAAHPEVDLQWLDMGSQEVFDRLRSERANPQADVWFGGPSTIFTRGVTEGLLAPYRPAWADALPAGASDPEDHFHAVYRTAPVLLYNRDRIEPDAVPTDWDDLLASRFRDRVLIRDPLASGTMRTFFGAMLARSIAATGSTDAGFDWLARLDAQTKEYVLNPALLTEKLVRGEGDVSVWELTDALWQREWGRPLDFRFPDSGTPVIVDAVGLAAGAPHPQAARDFLDWVGGREALLLAAERAFRLPARADLSPADLPEWARKVLADLVADTSDPALLAARDQEWMAAWDRTIRARGESRR